MFAKLLPALLGLVGNVGADIDNAVSAYRADSNNAQKAHTVAKGVLSLVDTLGPLLALLVK